MNETLIEEFHSNLSTVLSWIQESENLLDTHEDEEHHDVSQSRRDFSSHEEFMSKLANHKQKVDELNAEAKSLLTLEGIRPSKRSEIHRQRDLLNAKWSHLKSRATEKQSMLQDSLNMLQQRQLANMKAWLIMAEDKIAAFTEPGPDLQTIKSQFEEHKKFQNEVARQQEVVDSLANFILVEDPDLDTEQIEDDLTGVGEKWATVCRMVEERGTFLEKVTKSWSMLVNEEKNFNQWVSKVEKRLAEMEEAAAETDTDSEFVAELVKRLQKLEDEMEKQHVHYSEIEDDGQRLRQILSNRSGAYVEVSNLLQRITDVWDSTVQRMENLGNALTMAAANARAKQSNEKSKKKEKEEENEEEGEEVKSTFDSDAKSFSSFEGDDKKQEIHHKDKDQENDDDEEDEISTTKLEKEKEEDDLNLETKSHHSSSEGVKVSKSNAVKKEEVRKEEKKKEGSLDSGRNKLTQSQSLKQDPVMVQQQKQLDSLNSWLKLAEDKIAAFTDPEPDLATMKSQFVEHKKLQYEVAQKQELVDSLANFIPIDDSDENEEKIEHNLRLVREKWATVCTLVDERGTFLETVTKNWSMLIMEEQSFSRWVTKVDKILTELEGATSETEMDPEFVAEVVKRLKKLEDEMERQHVHYSKIAGEGLKLLKMVDRRSTAYVDIANLLQRLTEIWVSTVQRMENLGNTLTSTATSTGRKNVNYPNGVVINKSLKGEDEIKSSNVLSLKRFVTQKPENQQQRAIFDSWWTESGSQSTGVGDKWSTVCHLVNERSKFLDTVSKKWSKLINDEQDFNQWVSKVDKCFATLYEEAASDPESDCDLMAQLVKRIQNVEEKLSRNINHEKQDVEELNLIDKVTKRTKAYSEIAKSLQKLSEISLSSVNKMEMLGDALTCAANRKRKQSTTSNGYNEPIKKRVDSSKIREWKRTVETLSTWMGRIEGDLGLDEPEQGSVVWEELAIEEQQILFEDTDSAVESKKAEVDQVLREGRQMLIEFDSAGEDISGLHEIIERVRERWSLIKKTVEEKRNNIKWSIELQKLKTESEAVSGRLDVHIKWINGVELTGFGNKYRLRDECKLRRHSLDGQRERISRMERELNRICNQLPQLASDPVAEQIRVFFESWQELNERLESLEERVNEKPDLSVDMEAAQKATNGQSDEDDEPSSPQPKVILALEKMQSWLFKVEETIVSQKIQVESLQALEKKLKLLTDLESDLIKEESNYRYLTSPENQSLGSSSDANWRRMINTKVSNLRLKWTHVSVLLKNVIRKMNSLIRLLPQFEEETISLSTWIEEANLFLEEPIAFGDLETLESQMEQCSIMAIDIQDTVTERVNELNFHGNQIIEILDMVDTSSSGRHSEQRIIIKEKIDLFNQSWNKVCSAASERQVKIDEAITKTKDLLQLFSRIEKKMNQLAATTSSDPEFENLLAGAKEEVDRVTRILHDVEGELATSTSASIEDMIKKRDSIKKQIEKLEKSISLKHSRRLAHKMMVK